jgi:heme/copper-type cytochrome/quinol oxidase subunit 3
MKNSFYLENRLAAKNEQHPFHILPPSHLPFTVALIAGMFVATFAFLMHKDSLKETIPFFNIAIPGFPSYWRLLILFSGLILFICIWARDVVDEATFQGFHTRMVQKGLRYGMILFIASEVMFFFSFFWTFFHVSTSPAVGIGCVWPPKGIEVLNPWHLPLANTVILLSSGVCTVWAHRALLGGFREQAALGLYVACMYGILFSWLQFLEYGLAGFSINDSVYGSIFYMATGFHGMHVVVGTILLTISYYRVAKNHFSRTRHLGF